MNRIHVLLAVTLFAPLVTPASAQLPVPPVIQVTSQTREFYFHLIAENEDDPDASYLDHSETAPGNGPFVAHFGGSVSGTHGTSANGTASCTSVISQFIILGEGQTDGFATAVVAGTTADANMGSMVNIEFMVPVDATFSISGSLEATSEGIGQGAVSIGVMGTDQSGLVFSEMWMANSYIGPDPVDFFHIQSVLANTPITLMVGGSCSGTSIGTGPLAGTSTFDFKLDFGDRDGDGLLDDWEINGINVDDDPEPEINLPEMDADPDHKDLFIEVDAMDGVYINEFIFNSLLFPFGDAPADMVDNPDGQDGINIHIVVDEVNLPNISLSGDQWPGEFDGLKADYFGTVEDRQNSNWQDLRAAREKVFRYCLWADSLIMDGKNGSGLGETPGDDFIVAAGFLVRTYPLPPNNLLSRTFMHELGHTLGLEHGGRDSISYKPNYLSVMNYTYQGFTPDAESHYFLDYSSKLVSTLNEASLQESAGLDGPSGRKIIFNSSLEGVPPAWKYAAANLVPMDWNANGVLDPEPFPLDINRLMPSFPPSPDEELVGSIDWDHLWYNLNGHGNHQDGGRIMETIPTELDEDDILELLTITVEGLPQISAVDSTTPAARFALLAAAPNPFNPTTEIRFVLAHPGPVELKIFDLRGRLVRSLVDGEELTSGSHVRVWDGTSRNGRTMASGVYFYRLVAGDFRSTRSVTLLK